MALNIFGKTYSVNKKVLEEVSREAFMYLGSYFEVNLRFVSESEIKALNMTYRSQNTVTDVLSFRLEESEFGGDVAICYQEIKKESQRWDMSLSSVAAFLLVHGILHLAGFDHTNDSERVKMEKAEETILKKKGIQIVR